MLKLQINYLYKTFEKASCPREICFYTIFRLPAKRKYRRFFRFFQG